LGGSPSVWNTCVFFFQAMLLLGYGYSHLTTRYWQVRYQAIAHCGLLLLPLPLLPIALLRGWVPPPEINPILWLLVLLLLSVGLPFFVVATSAPLVQKWFAHTGHPAGKDPYFLYAASNLGSLLGLLSYPILIEPHFSLTDQSWLWTGGYGLLTLLLMGCAVGLWRSQHPGLEAVQPSVTPLESSSVQVDLDSKALISKALISETLTARQQAQWVLLAFVPSSLLLGVTTYLTTDLAAVPLLWAVPLMLYLLTFVLAFAQPMLLPRRMLVVLSPLLLTPLCLLFLLRVVQPIALILPLHLLGLFVVASLFHGELARSRPNPQHLTIFYFWIAFGGVLGGLLNAIAAPLLFSSVLEYPLVLLLSLLLLQTSAFRGLQFGKLKLALTLPLSLGILLGGLVVGFSPVWFNHSLISIGLGVGLLLAIRYAFVSGWWSFAVGVGVIVLLHQFSVGTMDRVLTSDRSFFGVYRVLVSSRSGGYHSLLHGTTLHGKQSLDPSRRDQPLTYFSRTGPIGQLFESLSATEPPERVAVLGLGIGTLAAYSQPGQQWTFYEIDPLAERLARDPRYFTFVQDARAAVEIVLGDARLTIAAAPDHQYDLLFMDAFSSDSIPLHLMTREAIEGYLSKLSDRGLLAVNITNRYLDLAPVLSALGQSLNLATLEQYERTITSEDREQGKAPSHWVLLTRQADNFGTLLQDDRWQPLPATSIAPWTDDFSNLLQAIRFAPE
jgi:spermidine synthase